MPVLPFANRNLKNCTPLPANTEWISISDHPFLLSTSKKFSQYWQKKPQLKPKNFDKKIRINFHVISTPFFKVNFPKTSLLYT